jgi:hypothetical protein
VPSPSELIVKLNESSGHHRKTNSIGFEKQDMHSKPSYILKRENSISKIPKPTSKLPPKTYNSSNQIKSPLIDESPMNQGTPKIEELEDYDCKMTSK